MMQNRSPYSLTFLKIVYIYRVVQLLLIKIAIIVDKKNVYYNTSSPTAAVFQVLLQTKGTVVEDWQCWGTGLTMSTVYWASSWLVPWKLFDSFPTSSPTAAEFQVPLQTKGTVVEGWQCCGTELTMCTVCWASSWFLPRNLFDSSPTSSMKAILCGFSVNGSGCFSISHRNGRSYRRIADGHNGKLFFYYNKYS